MVKRRAPRTHQQPTPEQIEAFAAGVDGGSSPPASQEKEALDPDAKRDFKAIRVPFNEYEYRQLEALAKATGRTKLNAIRWAILQAAEAEDSR
ncbi:hypothetical protein [Vreelandella alkaliphila]|uniref:hypothetical protein n=1 Tax=Vreelandella alkaliphila TaxID=272774 RepID=UPI003FD776A5